MSEVKDNLITSASLRCDCLCSTVVVDKLSFVGEPAYYNISFQDSATNWGYFTLKQRLKAAWYMLTRKPFSYADVYINDERDFAKFVGSLVDMVGSRQISVTDGKCHMCWDCPDGCPVDNPFDSKNTPGRFDNEVK